jgi:hypothetical protein
MPDPVYVSRQTAALPQSNPKNLMRCLTASVHRTASASAVPFYV